MHIPSTHISVALFGDPFVGKTALFNRLTQTQSQSAFSTTYIPSVGADFKTITAVVPVDGELIRATIKVWDTAGLERIVSVSGHTFPNTDVAVLCADVTNAQSFQNVVHWHDEFALASPYRHSPPAFIIALTKVDEGRVSTTRQIALADAQGWAVLESVDPSLYPTTPGTAMDPYPPVIELSARDNESLQGLLSLIVQRGMRRHRFDTKLAMDPYYSTLPIPPRVENETDVNTCRIVIFGDECIGKEAFLAASFLEDLVDATATTSNKTAATAPELYQNTFNMKDQISVRATAWSVPGRDKVGALPFCKGCSVVICVVKLGYKASLTRVPQWSELAMLEGHIRDRTSLTFALVGVRTVEYDDKASEEAAAFAEENGMIYCELPEAFEITILGAMLVMETILSKAREQRTAYVTERVEGLADFYMIQCPHAGEGCTWTGRTRELKAHTATCPEEKMKCRFEGCSVTFRRKDRMEHEGKCPQKPQTCLLCEMPFVSLHEHMLICPRRRELEDLYVPCPLGPCGCTQTHLRRGDVTAHVEASIGVHVIMLAGVIQSIRAATLNEEKARIVMIEEVQREYDGRLKGLQGELAATKKDLEAERALRKDLQLEMSLLWQSVEEMKKMIAYPKQF